MSQSEQQTEAQRSQWRSPQYSNKLSLVPVDFTSQRDRDELLCQRKACGWGYEPELLDYWQKACAQGLKDLWFIMVPAKDTTPAADDTAAETQRVGQVNAGHISLASEANPPDLELANPDHSVVSLSTFFIYPEHRSGGLGRAAVAEVEKRALAYPQCKAIAVDAISRRYEEDGSPRWGGRLERTGFVRRPGRSNEDWYTRLGYVKWKEEPRYPHNDGDPELLWSAFLKKQLR